VSDAAPAVPAAAASPAPAGTATGSVPAGPDTGCGVSASAGPACPPARRRDRRDSTSRATSIGGSRTTSTTSR
jgi:hypothetical protein